MFGKRMGLVYSMIITMFFSVSANAAVRVVTADDVVAMKKAEKNNLIILDVRTPGEFAQGRIPGALLMPINQVPQRMSALPKDRKIIVVCAVGGRSAAVADYLSRNGYTSVMNYSGGMADWAGRGLKMER